MNDKQQYTLMLSKTSEKNPTVFMVRRFKQRSEIRRKWNTKGMHKHNFCEMHMLLSGSLSYLTQHGEVHMKVGDTLFFPPGVMHMVTEFSNDAEKYAISFSLPDEGNKSFQFINGLTSHKVIKHSDTIDACMQLFEMVFKAASHKWPRWRDNAYWLSCSIISIITSAVSNLPDDKEAIQPMNIPEYRVWLIEQYINDNITTNISRSLISEYMHLSIKQIDREVRSARNRTLHQLIIDIRTETAKRLLKETDRRLNEVAACIGYYDLSSFMRMFKQQTGISPGEYRKATRTIENV